MAVDNATIFTGSVILFVLAYLVLLVENGIFAYCISFGVVCTGVYVGSKLIPRGRVDPEGRAVFITGCDTGFGHELACRLDSLGFRVFAGCLVPNGVDARKLKAKTSSNLLVVPCDVTSDVSVNNAKEIIAGRIQSDKHGLELFAVINNAGIWRWTEVEWASVEMYKGLAEINIYGMVRVTKAFLPMIRQTKGRVVNVGSISGLWSIPCNSAYCMTKYEIESYTDCLRYEMHKWGVKVVLIEPGQYGRTTAIDNYLNGYSDQLWKSMDDTTRADYGRPYVQAWQEYFKSAMADCYADPSPVIEAMVDGVTSRRPKHRYLVGGLLFTYLEAYWNRLLPSWLTDRQFYQLADMVATPAALMTDKQKST